MPVPSGSTWPCSRKKIRADLSSHKIRSTGEFGKRGEDGFDLEMSLLAGVFDDACFAHF